MTPLTGSKQVLNPLKTVTGFTLMEIAVLMMVMAIGLCPLLASSGGLSGLANGAATASGVNKGTSQAQIMAYSVMQQALTGQIPTGNQMAGTLESSVIPICRKEASTPGLCLPMMRQGDSDTTGN